MAKGINKIDNIFDTEWYREQVAIAKRQNLEHIAKHGRTFSAIMAKADADADDGGGGASDHHASKVADLLVEAGSFPHRAAALQHLLHKPSGQALLQRMHKAAEQTERKTTMTSTHAEFVQSVVKQYGFVALAKSGVQDGKAYGLDESTCTRLATEYAHGVYPSDRPDVAFSKLYEREESIRRFFAVVKAQTLEPVMVGGVAATHEAINNTEQSEAYAQLEAMAAKLRASSPWFSAEQAFAKVFEDPKNGKLAAKAHVRPSPTTSYEFPR
jgi:hypothetical protein